MSFEQKLFLGKPHIRKVKGVWCVYFSLSRSSFDNWKAYDFATYLQGTGA